MKKGLPTRGELGAWVKESVDCWKNIARRLNVDESKIIEIQQAAESLPEMGFQMLQHWKQKEGGNATYEALYDALTDPLVARKDLAEEFCCSKGKYLLQY